MTTLHQYLSKNPEVNKAKLARTVGIAESSLYKYINQMRNPELAIAIRIVKATKGKVTYEGLLIDPMDGLLTDQKIVTKRKKKVKVKIKEQVDTDLL